MSSDYPSNAPSLRSAPLGSRPIALVLSGGAALSSWQGGVLCALVEKYGLQFKAIAGTSGGAINGFAYCSGELALLRELWRNVPKSKFLRISPRWGPPSLWSQEALRSYLSGFISDERCRPRWKAWLHVLAADLVNNVTVQARYAPGDGPWDEPLLEYILGSMAVPFLFPPVRIASVAGRPERLLVDGHLTSFLDLRPLIDAGAADIVFVNVAQKGNPGADRLPLRRYISAMVQQLLTAQVDNSVAAAERLPSAAGVRFFEFAPKKELTMSVFRFSRDECRDAFDQGLAEAGELLGRTESYRIGPAWPVSAVTMKRPPAARPRV